jgi:LemA protein
MKSILWVVGIVVIVGLYMTGLYNGLVVNNEAVDAQWAQVESQYQRRLDLVPNLVNSVQGAMKQEQTVFTALADARTKYGGAATADAKAAALGEFDSALSRLLVVMENYPQLQSIQAVRDLMVEIAGTENRISVERMRYNEAVRDYNIRVKSFPRTVLAGWFGFGPRTMFEATTGAEVAPEVQL